MTEAAAAAIVPATSSRRRGLEIAGFLDDRMKNNHERDGKKTFARNSRTEVRGTRVLRWLSRRGVILYFDYVLALPVLCILCFVVPGRAVPCRTES